MLRRNLVGWPTGGLDLGVTMGEVLERWPAGDGAIQMEARHRLCGLIFVVALTFGVTATAPLGRRIRAVRWVASMRSRPRTIEKIVHDYILEPIPK